MHRILLAVMVVVGCGGDGGVSIDSNDDNVCGEIAEVACHNLYRCCAEGEIEDFLGVSEPRTEAQCRDDVEVLCERSISTRLFSIQESRVRFDSEIMNNCLEAIVAPDDTCASVETKLPWAEACMNSAFVGTVAPNETCLFNHDCAGGLDAFCAPNQKCQMRPTAGFPCGTGCASQFFCQAGTCAPRVAAGGMCNSSSACQKDLFCDFNVTPAVCTARAPGGSPCTSNFGCASNQCVPGACQGTGFQCFDDGDCGGRCADDNSPCTTSGQCAIGNCTVSGAPCDDNTDCGATGGTCTLPIQCVPGDCIGDPVCTNATIVVDYCDDALGALPI